MLHSTNLTDCLLKYLIEIQILTQNMPKRPGVMQYLCTVWYHYVCEKLTVMDTLLHSLAYVRITVVAMVTLM